MDVFTVKELEGKSIGSVQITYVKQCKEGERVDFIRKRGNDEVLVEGKVDGELRVQMRITFNGV